MCLSLSALSGFVFCFSVLSTFHSLLLLSANANLTVISLSSYLNESISLCLSLSLAVSLSHSLNPSDTSMRPNYKNELYATNEYFVLDSNICGKKYDCASRQSWIEQKLWVDITIKNNYF